MKSMNMKLLALLSVLAVLSLAVADVQVEEHHHFVELAKLFRSEARAHFSTDKRFVQKAKQFHATVTEESYAERQKAHPVVVRFAEGVPVDVCHGQLRAEFGEHHVTYLQAGYALVTAPLPALEAFAAGAGATAMSFHAPMTPEMKVAEGLLKDSKMKGMDCVEEMQVPDGRYMSAESTLTRRATKVTLRVLLAPLPQEEREAFLAFVHAESGASSSTANTGSRESVQGSAFEYHFPDKQKAHTRNMLDLQLPSCEAFLTVALLFAARREVLWVDRQLPHYPHNRWSNGLCDSGTQSSSPLQTNAAANFTGEGEIISITDTGIDTQHCYFRDPDHAVPFVTSSLATTATMNMDHRKIAQYITHTRFSSSTDEIDDSTGHGTHVAGIFAGRPLDRWGDYEKFEGMSSQAKIVFFDIGKKDSSEAGGSLIVPSDINTGLFEVMYDLGARVFSNSWGSSSNSYDSDAVSLDTFLWTYKDACVLFSNGNSGETGANSAYSPAISKNVIAVGASMNDHNAWLAYYPQYSDKRYGRDSMGGFSSQGPTRDNRMKPDVLAPGFFITSAKGYYNSTEPFCEETALYGTSMSCPTAAGFASKVRQYFKEGHYPSGDKSTADAFTPSGALLKATLIHSSQPMLYSTATADFGISSVSSYPSNQQGYGRIQMSTVLNFAASSLSPLSLFVVGGAFSSDLNYVELTNTGVGNGHTYSFTCSSSSTKPIRVTMHYTDYPGSTLTTQSNGEAMRNLLIAYVTQDSTGTVHSPYLASGNVRDNTQMIDIDSPVAGATYTITVYASQIISGPQPYALLASQTGANTYVTDGDAAAENSAPADQFDAAGTLQFVVPLALLSLALMALVIYFQRVFKKHQDVEMDAEQMDAAHYETALGGGGSHKIQGMFAKIRNIRKAHSANKAPAGDGFEADFAD